LINQAVIGPEFTQNDFKQSFINMLIATSRDFTGRSVLPGNQLRVDEHEDDGQATIGGGGRAPVRVVSGGGGGGGGGG
jgi:hypothetical protein